MSEKNNLYSHELNDVLNYMVDILVNEFPTDIFTPEYLMIAILDTKNCHANMILDNCLMSNNMEELKDAYMSVLKEHAKPILIEKDSNKVKFDLELNKILENAKKEADKTNSPITGTEHVLLSILNPDNGIKIQTVFNSVGIEYDFILDKCMDDVPKRKTKKTVKAKGLINNNGGELKPAIFPLKSEVNAMAVVSKDEYISKYTTNLNNLVKEGKIDKLVGREKEINEIINVLARRKKNNVILVGNGGVGKCLAKGTMVLMYDGTFKKVEEVAVGDKLMGIDSTPRNVLALGHGVDEMYTVHQQDGSSYTVNSEHILSLKTENGDIVDVPIKEYVLMPSERKKALFGYKTGLLEFNTNITSVNNPYGLGAEIGSLLDEDNDLLDKYKTAQSDIRWTMLCGIIDSKLCQINDKKDGYIIEFQKSKKNFENLTFICKSLGLSVNKNIEIDENGFEHYQIRISGNGLYRLTIKNKAKMITVRNLKSNYLNTKILSVENIGKGEYYGFQIDGDRRFVLNDFTVTHNTQIVNGLATMIVNGNVPPILDGKELVMIDIMSLVSGTHFRGMFEERVKGLFDELKSSNKYILFIDDMQNVLKSGGKDKDTDLSGMIGDILSGGDVRVIGTTTFKDYRNSIEANTSISRKLQKIIIEAPSQSESIDILMNSKKYYEDYHNVTYTDDAIEKAVEFADRYITDRSLPDSAFDIIDLAGASTSANGKEPSEIVSMKKRLLRIESEKNEALNAGEFEKIDSLTLEDNMINKKLSDYKRSQSSEKTERTLIDSDAIANTVSVLTKVPIAKLSSNEKQKIAHIDDILKNSVIGQDEAVNAICKVIKRNKVGLGDKTKTMANILMAGPTGCGKCVSGKTTIKIRNKKTNEIREISIEDFKKLVTINK